MYIYSVIKIKVCVVIHLLDNNWSLEHSTYVELRQKTKRLYVKLAYKVFQFNIIFYGTELIFLYLKLFMKIFMFNYHKKFELVSITNFGYTNLIFNFGIDLTMLSHK